MLMVDVQSQVGWICGMSESTVDLLVDDVGTRRRRLGENASLGLQKQGGSVMQYAARKE